MGSAPPPAEAPILQQASQGLSFSEGKMWKWRDERWLQFPPHALRILIMEEVHVA
jgi:hypothetical protein